MSYRPLVSFLLPLAVVSAAVPIGQQFLNGGMARVHDAVATLAAYGVAWGLNSLFSLALYQASQLGLVLVSDRRTLRLCRLFQLALGVAVSCVLLVVAETPVGTWLIEDLHRLEAPLAENVRFALLCLVPLPLLRGFANLHFGLLLQFRQTTVASASTVARIFSSVAAVFVLLQMDFVQQRPILLPVLVHFTGFIAEAAVLLWGYVRVVRHRLSQNSEANLNLSDISRFYWPLVFVSLVQTGTGPLINLFVARGPAPQLALASLVIVESLASVLCAWLIELRSLPAAFAQEPEARRYIKRFCVYCGLLTFGSMVLFLWTPLRGIILMNLIGLDAAITEACFIPLVIFTSLAVTMPPRGYVHGIAYAEQRTKALVPSVLSRIAASLAILVIVPMWGVHGAAMGASAMCVGILAETLVAWWAVSR